MLQTTQDGKPVLIMDQHWRKVEELFSPSAYEHLSNLATIIGGVNWPMRRNDFLSYLPQASFVVAATPHLSQQEMVSAPNLKAVIEVSGTFAEGLDYQHCFDTRIEVLSCAPGFQKAVAEMTLAMILAGGRGLIDQHERFRVGHEHWLDDRIGHDFSLYKQTVGFVGFGAIARETSRLLSPFESNIIAYDPWLAEHSTGASDLPVLVGLEDLVAQSRCIVIAASPTEENYQLINASLIAGMRPGTLVVLASRAHLVDFDAMVAAADAGHIRFATDVFPAEPVTPHEPVRRASNVILSPHRAAAVEGGRHPIGDMIVHDIENILEGRPNRRLQSANPNRIESILRAPTVAAH